MVAAEELRRAVQHEVRPLLERPQVDRGRGGGVDDGGTRVCDGRVEVGQGEQRIRRRFDPYEVDVLGRCAGLVELDQAEAPVLQHPHQDRVP